jgi:hypothetical protein
VAMLAVVLAATILVSIAIRALASAIDAATVDKTSNSKMFPGIEDEVNFRSVILSEA